MIAVVMAVLVLASADAKPKKRNRMRERRLGVRGLLRIGREREGR